MARLISECHHMAIALRQRFGGAGFLKKAWRQNGMAAGVDARARHHGGRGRHQRKTSGARQEKWTKKLAHQRMANGESKSAGIADDDQKGAWIFNGARVNVNAWRLAPAYIFFASCARVASRGAASRFAQAAPSRAFNKNNVAASRAQQSKLGIAVLLVRGFAPRSASDLVDLLSCALYI